ncbi:Tll0287-like domain-containing protein [Haliea sp. E17]|uniref:Tll0287-like domain-containing protein n=1 Tax=Haliea sp. E17 TaxID=3401576 RepID=UPI003AAD6595
MIPLRKTLLATGLASLMALPMTSQADEASTPMFTPKQMTDWLHLVMSSDRTVYTRMIVNRLQNKEKVIKASEHFEDEKALVLPAQMFRFGAEMVGEATDDFSYSLLSEWPINKQNAPRTEVEKTGLAYVAANKGENYYATEELGGKKYFTAVYADTAVAPACVTCHNDHKDTPRSDFKIGDVMGGVVIRVPL